MLGKTKTDKADKDNSNKGDAQLLVLIKKLNERAQTLSIAESCTGGLLSAQLTSHAGISSIFFGGLVSYSNESKQNLLDVPGSLIKAVGAVSTPVALAMARGVRERFNSSWSISITGIAGPNGGSPQKPVGTVCFAICGPGIEETSTQFFSGARKEIQNSSAKFAVEFLTKFLK